MYGVVRESLMKEINIEIILCMNFNKEQFKSYNDIYTCIEQKALIKKTIGLMMGRMIEMQSLFLIMTNSEEILNKQNIDMQLRAYLFSLIKVVRSINNSQAALKIN